MENKKGVSPVVATVLLVVIVIVIAIIVILWLRGFLPNAITKFGDENIELACDKVILSAYLSNTALEISNNGNVPIQRIDLKLIQENGDYDYFEILRGEVDYKIKQGRTIQIKRNDIPIPDNGKILVIPVLMGKTESGEEERHICDERYGVEVIV